MAAPSNIPKPARPEPAIRVVMMPRDTNGEGTIFGGVILSYIDQAGFVEAKRQANHRYVTVCMDKVDFKQPVFVGDLLSLYAETSRIGRTSLTVKINAFAQRAHDPDTAVPVTEAEVTFVAIGDDHRPTAILSDPGI